MNNVEKTPAQKKWDWVYDLLFIGVLLAAAYFRFTGADWGELNIQHPDEDFLSSVTLGIQPVGTPQDQLGIPPTQAAQNWRAISAEAYPDCKAWGGYFDTNCSPLNPHNRGFSFYVYGDLPVILTRYLAVLLKQMDHLTLFGRYLSGVMDLGTILLLYLIVKRIYGSRVALLASAFSAVAVEQIQQSHFYTTDNFAVFFMFLTLYFAVLIATEEGRPVPTKLSIAVEDEEEDDDETQEQSLGSRLLQYLSELVRDPLTLLSIGYGIALGMAVGSKINAVAIAVTLPVALVVRYSRLNPANTASQGTGRTRFQDFLSRAFIFLIIGAVVSVLAFRVFQPYAFNGLRLDPQWLANIREQRGQATPNNDIPWNLQWARRNHLYSFQNLTVWGLGLPLGILAWAGFLWMGWCMLKGEWRQHILLWSWTAIYFTWQSLQYNPTMRYQLPSYPLLAMMAAWLVGWLWDKGRQVAAKGRRSVILRLSSVVLGMVVLALTGAWAYAFTRIYVCPEPRIAASNWIYQNVPGPINLQVQTAGGTIYNQPLPFTTGAIIQTGIPYQAVFVSQNDGVLTSILLAHVADPSASGVQTLRVILSTASDPQSQEVLADLSVTASFTPTGDKRGLPVTLTLDHPVSLQRGFTYYLQIQTTGGVLALVGSSVANETDYDWPLPFRIANYDAFGGIYPGGLYLQVYWDDNDAKLVNFQSVLDQADYIFIPTNHQYAQITRLPERYPLTTEYYRQLIGCPADKNIIWCYETAKPGMFHGTLDFDLVAVFESYPTIGPLVINDESAEEAFTFYDHPKVLIFKKNAAYDPGIVQSILGKVDYSQAIHLTPGQADTYKSLMLPADQLAVQQAGGTWSQLFDWNAFQNKYPGLGLGLWYLVMFLVGLFAYPIVRTTLPGLPDRGYPLARIAGLVIWAWFSWIAGSFGVSYSKLTIGIALGLIALIGALLAYRQRQELKQEWQTKKKYFLTVEGLFLAFFLLDLLIRLGNPDLWHDPNGGERPMEFAFFNAILKSTTFPPYDPWFAGGYINYYYYGYVIVGTPVKLLGIVPSIAYNLILPTLFACLALGGFSVAWNLVAGGLQDGKLTWKSFFSQRAFIAGMTGSAVLVLLGNLAIVRLFIRSFMCIAAPAGQLGGIGIHDCIITPGSAVDKASIFVRLWWTIKGFFLTMAGQNLDTTIRNARELYWGATRVLPAASGGPITEFPLASFLWSDLHAHMMALGVTVLAIAWVLSVVLAKAKWKSHLDTAVAFILGGLVIGALKPANTWDFYTYLLLACIVLAYVIWHYVDTDRFPINLPKWVKRLSCVVGAVALLTGLSFLFYQPFTHWFGQAYNSFDAWKGNRSDISSYLVHWGVFLFFIVSWMVWETREWMAATPVSSLRKLRPYRDLIIGGVVFLFLLLVLQQVWAMSSTLQSSWKGVTILWLALPLVAWAGVLILRPGLPDTKRLVLFMVGTALVITMVVEILVVKGDIGRQNTVFKFYMQAWVLLGVSAAAAFNWLLAEFRKWLPAWRTFWLAIATLLVTGAALFLFIYGIAKVNDRLSSAAPHTLDSMTYMVYAHYSEFGVDMDLSEDYRAICWMQNNVQGSPVIVEAAPAGVQYAWLGRFSIYTGLPDVVGWEWHEMQQRVLGSADVMARGKEVDAFYATTDLAAARDFLRKYNVRYIIVGQLERAKYAPDAPNGPVHVGDPDGLLKFDQQNGTLWNEVYRDGQTVIYEVPAGGEGTP